MNGHRLDFADRSEILDILARAAWAVDERRPEDFVEQFTSTAVIERLRREGEPRRWGGERGDLTEFVPAAWAGVHVEDAQTWASDVVMTPDRDSAHVVSNSLRVGSASGGLSNVLLADAEIHDTLVHDGARWRIAHRRIVPLGASVATTSTPASTPVTPRLDADADAVDRVEIEALFADYAWALDTADTDAVLRLFSDDAVMQDPFGRFTGTGPDGIRRFFEGLFVRPEFAGRIHWVSQLVLSPIDDGYRADSYALVPASFGSGAVNLHLMAFYRDVVVRERGRWKFRERLVGPRWERVQPVRLADGAAM
jgi:hypothetical protein